MLRNQHSLALVDLEKAVDLGGKKLVGPVKLPNNTLFGWFADPEGNMIGVYAEARP